MYVCMFGNCDIINFVLKYSISECINEHPVLDRSPELLLGFHIGSKIIIIIL